MPDSLNEFGTEIIIIVTFIIRNTKMKFFTENFFGICFIYCDSKLNPRET